MRPVTSQDTWWIWLQMDQGPMHQHVKLHGLGGLLTRSTQPERDSRSPEHHDLSVQIRRLKRHIMAKVWLLKLWALMIPSIWTYVRPNSGQGVRRYAPKMPVVQTNPKSDRLSSKSILEILSSFPRNTMHTKIEDNFVSHNLDTEFALFGVRTWEIWCRQWRAVNQENLDKAECMETKFGSLPSKISCKARWTTPQDSPKEKNTTPLAPKEVLPFRSNHSTDAIHRKTTAARWGRDWDELVARINAGGGKEARGGLQAVVLGVFPSFITSIFTDDVLRSLHDPYVL
jgi:hypothetical protein